MRAIHFFLLLGLLGCNLKEAGTPTVAISTELGDIEIEVYSNRAPITAANFLAYVDSGRYDTLACFYRVVRMDNQQGKPVKIEVIQGGFYHDSLIEKHQYPPIPHETTLTTGIKHEDGVISMARAEVGTASSEFFICIGSQPALDYGGIRNSDGEGFAAFGKVVKGMDVVKSIQQLKDNGQYLEQPVRIIKMERRN